MSSYKTGKPIFIGSIVVLISAIVIPFAIIGFFLLASDISYKIINERVNFDYYEKLIIKTDKLVVFYNNIQYLNPSSEFREYYSESHKTPVDNSSSDESLVSDNDSFFVCAVDGNYVYKAIYYKNTDTFELYCIPAGGYDRFEAYHFDVSKYLTIGRKNFPYNSQANFDSVISYLTTYKGDK